MASAKWCDQRRISLTLIATIANAAYTTIAPILPLELDKYNISEQWVSLIFLSFSIGSSVAPPLVARYFESMGTVMVMCYAMIGLSILFWCLAYIFEFTTWISSTRGDENNQNGMLIVGLLTLLQFFMGFFFSSITTGYYSLATLIFVEKEAAMSSIEVGVGIGYIVGPILGSFIYDEMGYCYAYTCISMGVISIALVTWKYIYPCLKYTKASEGIATTIETLSDLEAPGTSVSYNSFENEIVESERRGSNISIVQQSLNVDGQEERTTIQQPSTTSLLKHPRVLIAALTIMWINVSWTFIEPLLAKRLDNHFHAGKKEIGIVFSLSNIIYVPVVFLVKYLPKHRSWRHWVIFISTALTPISALLIGSNKYSLVIFGIVLIGLLPTPVWILLLPFMQEESEMLYPSPSVQRSVNDITAGIYNSFMTFGQLVGYAFGPILAAYNFATMTKLVALLIFLQSILFYFGTKGHKPRRRKTSEDSSISLSSKQIV